MIVSIFSVSDKNGKEKFFEKSFFLTDVNLDIVLGQFLLTMSNTKIDFQARDLQWRFYTIGNILSTPRRVELIGRKEFKVITLNPKHEALIVYIMACIRDSDAEINLSKRAQIVHPKADDDIFKVVGKCADFADVFSSKLVAKLPEYMGINDYAVK